MTPSSLWWISSLQQVRYGKHCTASLFPSQCGTLSHQSLSQRCFVRDLSVGSAEWIDAAKTRCKIFYQTPAEWAAVLYAWVNEHGMLGTVYTIYELSTGAVVAGAGRVLSSAVGRVNLQPQRPPPPPPSLSAFEGLDTYVLLKAAEVLASQGKVGPTA